MRKGIRSGVLLFMIGMLSVSCAAVQPRLAQLRAPTSDVEAQINASRQRFIEAYQRGDATAISELFTEDAAFTGTISPVWRQGRDTIRTNWENVFRQFPKSQIVFREPVLRFYNLAPDRAVTETTTAVETGFFDMHMQDVRGREVHTPGKYSAVWVWRDGRWMLVNYHTSGMPVAR